MEEIHIFQRIETLIALQLQYFVAGVKVDLVFAQNHHSTQVFKGEYPVIHCDPVAVKTDGGFLIQKFFVLVYMDLAQLNGLLINRSLCQY